jgi:TPR repeat protein
MKDDQLGFRLIKIAAEKGLEVAMMNIAVLASNGRGTPVDYPTAAEFLQKAADIGNADAAYQLAQFYLHGWGVPQNKSRAFQLFQQASSAGYAPARTALARCFEEGIGTEVDLQTASSLELDHHEEDERKFWLYAALNNDAVAARCVGERFLTGTGGFSVDLVKGRRYLMRAADAGDAQAQYQLATCCTQGIGGPQNAMAGLKWLERSAGQNYPEAVAELQAIRKEDERVQQEFKEMMENLRNAGGIPEVSTLPATTSKRSKDAKKRSILKRIFRGKPGGAGQ